MRPQPNPTTITLAKLIRKVAEPSHDQLVQVENAVRAWLGL
jgi:hypothetical protein